MTPEPFNINRNNPQGRSRPQVNQQTRSEFRYKIDTHLHNDENILHPLISNKGDKNVEELAKFLSEEKLTSNQARKFYDAFIKIYNQHTSNEAKKIQLLMLKAQAEYSFRRKTIKEGFKSFIENRLEVVVKSEKFENELEAFKLHFQSLIAYLPK